MASQTKEEAAAAADAAHFIGTRTARRTAAIEEKQDQEGYIAPDILAMAASWNASLNSVTANLLREPRPSQNHQAAAEQALKQAEEAGVRHRKQRQGYGHQAILTEQEIKAATLAGTIPTAVVDSGASSTCVKPEGDQNQRLEYGRYKWKGLLFEKTGEKSKKLFSMALNHVARARTSSTSTSPS